MPQLIESIESEISYSDYSILLSISDIDERSKRECIRNMIDKMVDGIIMTNVYKENKEDLKYLKSNRIPFVLVLNRLGNFESHYVGADFYYGSIKMMSHLYGLGLRRIAFITGTPDNISSAERLQGYKTFLFEHGLPYDHSLVEKGNFKYDGGFVAFNKLMSKTKDIQAVFCVNDYTALGAIDAAKKAHLKVPEDVVIVGFDDMQIASHSNIRLTTMRIPILKMAKTAVKILFDQIEGRQNKYRSVILKPELVIR
jgi:DNA-binding LacI/PurR family transcriptional regulator